MIVVLDAIRRLIQAKPHDRKGSDDDPEATGRPSGIEARIGDRLLDMAAQNELVINDVAYAELSIGYPRIEPLDAMLAAAGLVIAAIPRPALFLAGKAFQRYRAAGGTRTGVLPDFFVGAHAVIALIASG